MVGRVMLVVVAGLLGGCALTGCSASREEPVAAVTAAFFEAVERRDGTGACARLLPEAARSMESGDSSCAEEILKLDLEGGRVTRAQVWGDAAQLRAGQDTVFLARWGPGWRVAAAGCQARPDQPYECEVEA